MDTNYRYLLERLLKSPHPERMLKEFKENGAKYVSDYMLQTVDEYISEEQKIIVGIYNVKGKIPLSEYEPAVTEIKNNIKKANEIRGLFLFKNLQPQQNKNKPAKQISDNSFKLEKTDFDLLWEVLDTLKSKTLVGSETKLPRFKQAFSGGIVKGKTEWKGSIASLHFFIDEICKRIKNETKKQRWDITVKCFYIEGKELTIEKLENNKVASKKDKGNIKTAIGKLSYTPSTAIANTTRQ